MVGRLVGRGYEIVAPLGSGGMGRVYRGFQRSLEREVAIKVIRPDLPDAEAAVARFLVEARVTSQLRHPNIVSILDFGCCEPGSVAQSFLVMELLRGPDLGEVMAAGPVSVERTVQVVGQILSALGEAHQHGITHRDVKPANVILVPRRQGGELVKLIDFGVAQIASAPEAGAGWFYGTPAYMAPEQVLGGEVGPASDVYAVGVVLFEMLAGVRPFAGASWGAVMAARLAGQRPDPRRAAPGRDVPAALAEACVRALDVDPARRPSVDAFVDALSGGSARGNAASRAARLGRPPPPPRSLSRLSAASRGLRGRASELGWAVDRLLAAGDHAGIALWGRTGMGRTRLLEEIARAAAVEGAEVVRIEAEPSPLDEVGYAPLRTLIGSLSELALSDPSLASGEAASERRAARGLRAVFGAEPIADAPVEARLAAAGALAWAVERALGRAERPLVICVDDLDRLDGASLLAIGDVLARGSWRGRVRVAATSAERVRGAGFERLEPGLVRGLCRRDARALLAERAPGATLDDLAGDVEPLRVDAHARHFLSTGAAHAPPTLPELVRARVAALSPDARRVLAALAATGGGLPHAAAAALPDPAALDRELLGLADGGFVAMRGGAARVSHAVYAVAALEDAPRWWLCDLYERAAEALALPAEARELRAHHALRGRPDFAAFLLVEQAAALRSSRGDLAGAVELLRRAVDAARVHPIAELGAFATFGRKLVAALLDARLADGAERSEVRADASRGARRLDVDRLETPRLPLDEPSAWRQGAPPRPRRTPTLPNHGVGT
jgi:serine/threonine-protein kinase